MFAQELFGIKLFDFEEAQPWDTGTQFINVIHQFKSLKKYDGLPIEVTFEWEVKIWSIEGEELDKFSIIDVPEFKKIMIEKLNR